MPRSYVLVFSHRCGFEVDPVLDVLHERGVGVVRFNSDLDVGGSLLTLELHFGPPGVRLECDGRSIAREDVAVAWFQQPPPHTYSLPAPDQFLRQRSFDAAMAGVHAALRCPWVNAPDAAMRAANKPTQLLAAVELGISIPHTVVTNSRAECEHLVRAHATVAKNIDTPWFSDVGDEKAAVTTRMDPSWISDEAVGFAPLIYQAFHRRRADLRAVVVGSRLFCARTDEYLPSQATDVRAVNPAQAKYRMVEAPDAVAASTSLLAAYFGLDYFAADFMEIEDGSIFFLELNVCGSWWWIDRLCGGDRPIAVALADLLMEKGNLERASVA